MVLQFLPEPAAALPVNPDHEGLFSTQHPIRVAFTVYDAKYPRCTADTTNDKEDVAQLRQISKNASAWDITANNRKTDQKPLRPLACA